MTADRRRAAPVFAATLCALLVLLAMTTVGCGSGDGTTTTSAVEPAVIETEPATPEAGAGTPEADRSQGQGADSSPGDHGSGAQQSPSHTQAKAGKEPGDTAAAPPASEGDAETGAAGLGATADISPAAKRKLAKSCPPDLSKADCEALVAGFVKGRDAKATAVAAPTDCTAAMSRDDCEALLQAQKQAAEGSYSVNVQECLANPTPRCEAVLRPLFEQQYAATHPGQ